MKEQMTHSLSIKFVFGLGILIPGLIVFALQWRVSGYDSLIDKYECNRSVCEADFDGDGVRGTLSIDRAAPDPDFDSWFVVVDSDKELLREPRRSQDNTERTHAAIVGDSGLARLVIYDHLFDHNPPRDLVFVYDGQKLVKVPPTERDKKILAAMGAHDVTGSFERWTIFRLLAIPALLVYYAILTFLGWKVFFKRP